MLIAVFHAEAHFRTLRTTNPVTLRLFERVGPLHGIQPVQQTLCVGRYAQAPLLHLLLYHRVSAAFAHAVHHFVIGQHRAQLRTPVHHHFAHIGYAVVHQHFLLLFPAHGRPFGRTERKRFTASGIESFRTVFAEALYQFLNRPCLLFIVTIITVEHLLESPLRPVVITRLAGTYLSVPVKAETYLVQLFPVTVNILYRRHRRMLSGLYGILFGRQSVSVIPHGV